MLLDFQSYFSYCIVRYNYIILSCFVKLLSNRWKVSDIHLQRAIRRGGDRQEAQEEAGFLPAYGDVEARCATDIDKIPTLPFRYVEQKTPYKSC
jgi:hypothetical protein